MLMAIDFEGVILVLIVLFPDRCLTFFYINV